MKLAILGPEERPYGDLRILKEAKKVFDIVTYFPISKIVVESNEKFEINYRGKSLLDYDAVIPRIPGSYMRFGMLLLEYLKDYTILPIDPKAVFYTHNKFMTLIALSMADVPIPDTYLSLKRSSLEKILDKIKYPAVLKLVYGMKGKGVMFADSKQSALSIADTLESFKVPIFVEEFLKNPGEDIRMFVIGGEVFAAMKRKAQKGERRANVSIGGIGIGYEPEEEEEKIAVRAAKALGMGIAGVDVLKSKNKPYVIEVNVYPGLKGIENATGKNVAKRIVEYVKELAEEVYSNKEKV